MKKNLLVTVAVVVLCLSQSSFAWLIGLGNVEPSTGLREPDFRTSGVAILGISISSNPMSVVSKNTAMFWFANNICIQVQNLDKPDCKFIYDRLYAAYQSGERLRYAKNDGVLNSTNFVTGPTNVWYPYKVDAWFNPAGGVMYPISTGNTVDLIFVR